MDISITPSRSSTHAREVVQRVFRDYPNTLAIRLWDGETLNFGDGEPDAILILYQPRVFRELVLYRDPLRLAEAYFQGHLEIEGDLYAALQLHKHLQKLTLSVREKAALLRAALASGGGSGADNGAPGVRRNPLSRVLRGANSKRTNRAAIAYHYDVSNAFYRMWLDEQMVYSCAYFHSEDDSLDQAQRNKLDHICRKLRLRSGERLLDIGCGWGALLCWAAQYYGVTAHGITLSREQYEYCEAKIAATGLQGRVTVTLQDYRDLQGEGNFDKVVSVGMFEHVGLGNLPLYFDIARRMLKPGGLFLNHGITQDSEGWGKSVGTRFINRYVFPDGELDTVANVQRVMERAGFEVLDVEALRQHYALTLRHWVARLEANAAEARKQVSESVFRIWRLYMAACALQFEQGGIGVYQILASSRDSAPARVPLTRRDIYT